MSNFKEKHSCINTRISAKTASGTNLDGGLRTFIGPVRIWSHGFLFSSGPELMQPIYVSIFGGKNKPEVIQSAEGPWKEFLKLFATPLPSSIEKGDLQLWSPTRFENDYRDDLQVVRVYALAFDVDKHPIPSGLELQRALEGMQALVYTSSSATAQVPRWRVIFALSRPVTKEEYPALWAAVASRLPFPVGSESRNVGRAWFMPRRGTDEYYEVFETQGTPLDVDYWLAQAPTQPPPRPKLELVPPPSLPANADRVAKLETAALVLGSNWPAKGNGRHVAQRALSGALYRENWSREVALDFLCAVCRHAGDENRSKRAQTIRDTWTTGESGGQVAGWTALGEYVDPSIVSAARDLLKRNDLAKAAAELGVTTAPAAVQEKPASISTGQVDKSDKALPFEYGAWETEPPPVEFLVEGLIPKGCVSMWYGRADSLKTWLVYSLAIAMATGVPWLGKPTKKVKVGIVDYETGKGNVKRRLFMLRAGANQNLGTVAFATLKPNQPEFWGELAQEGFDIVFIDSLRKANPGGDENDSYQSIVPLELAAEFSEVTGCAVVYIHHAKKATSDGWPEFRGSSGIEDQVDCAFAVRKNETGAAKKTVDVKCVKPGDMRTPEDFTAEVEFNDTARTAQVRLGTATAGVVSEEATDARVQGSIKLVLGNGPTVLTDIRKRATGGNARIGDELKGMIERGEVVKMGTKYALDGEGARKARVLKEVQRFASWRSEADLAKAAYVETSFVKEMVRSGDICRRAAGEAGFLVVDRDE